MPDTEITLKGVWEVVNQVVIEVFHRLFRALDAPQHREDDVVYAVVCALLTYNGFALWKTSAWPLSFAVWALVAWFFMVKARNFTR